MEGDHEAIIEPEVFDMVQREMKKHRYSGVSIFSGKIKCGECGSWYGAKTWHSTDKYRRTVYRCNNKYKGNTACTTPHLTEDEIKTVFIKAVNILLRDKDEITENIEQVINALCDNAELLEEQTELNKKLTSAAEEAERYVNNNAHTVQDQNKYSEHYDKLVKKYETVKKKYDKVNETIAENTAREKELRQFMSTIKEQDEICEFDEVLWSRLVEYVTVYTKEDIRVMFKDGSEIRA